MIPHAIRRAENHDEESERGKPVMFSPMRNDPRNAEEDEPTRGIGHARLRESVGERGASENYVEKEGDQGHG